MTVQHQDTMGLQMTLTIGPGPCDGVWSEAQLRRGWRVYRRKLESLRSRTAGKRLWAWWRFEAGEDQPATEPLEALRLHELGQMDTQEAEAVRQRAREFLHHASRTTDLEDRGCIITAPPSALAAMRERRERDAAGWRRVLETVQAAA